VTKRPDVIVLPSVGVVAGAAPGDILLAASARLLGQTEVWRPWPEAAEAYDRAEAEWMANTQSDGAPGETVNKVVRGTVCRLEPGARIGYVDDVAPLATLLGAGQGIPVCAYRVAAGVPGQLVHLNLRSFGLAVAVAMDTRGEYRERHTLSAP
jgi:hypothetical protein